MYVYRTPAFEEELRSRSSLSEHFDGLCAELETMTLEEVSSRFERLHPYLKRKEGNLRLIACVMRVGDDRVLCWLKIYRRGDSAYEEFLRDRKLNGVRPELLRQWLKEQKSANSRSLQPSPPPLDKALLEWLKRPNWQVDRRGSIVYESQKWVQRFATDEIQCHWKTYSEAIATLADKSESLGETTNQPGIRLYRQDNCYILYSKITTADTPPRNVLFLLAPFSSLPSPTEIAEILSWLGTEDAIVEKIPDAIRLDELTAVVHRAYPSDLLAYEEGWLLLENEENSNLALSAEEEAILHAVSTSQPSLPLFLNGQAGSGKSTMLFHLFADYCHRHLGDRQERERDFWTTPHPLFLAYNDRLLDVAKKRVAALLASHHRFLEERGESEDLPDLSPFFQTFRTFLLNLLPADERDRFLETNYVSFHRFRQLFARKQQRNYSPERCWQVIRTFIKGYYLDERNSYFALEDYEEIPKKERTVSQEEFQEIYNSVWQWYRKYTERKELWDDQDLIREILKRKYYRPHYTAIFCDEAQDFTRLELQLIIRLSVFSNTDLEKHYVECLPFAFAGDPMQTLNPTGFRWESLKAAFYNEAIGTLSPTGKLNIKMNYTELQYNYRSLPSIVGVNNLIQLWRSALFEISDLQPQMSRKPGDFEPQKVIVDDIAREKLVESLQNTILIVPCDEGGELDYVREDEILCHLLSPEDKSNSPWNILSAIAAKGLEFKQVILYKFGEACPPELWRDNEYPSEKSRYFLNKLYVAASRATERLFVVDTTQGEGNLWRRASRLEEIRSFLSKISSVRQRERWEKNLQLIQIYAQPDCLKNDDVSLNAKVFETQGIDAKDPELMRRAKGAYKQLKDEAKVGFCEAQALKFEGHWLEAGQQFLAQGDREQAWNCFWEGMCWQELIRLHQGLTEKQDDSVAIFPFQLAIASFLAREKNVAVLQSFSQFLDAEIENGTLTNYRSSHQWKAAIETYGESIETLIHPQRNASTTETPSLETPAPDISPRQWQTWGMILWRLHQAKYPKMAERAGACFYRAQNHERAVECWEAIGVRPKIEYNLAKAEILGIPAGLDYLLEAQSYDLILALWKQANQPQHPQWLNAVAPALEAQQEPLKALKIYSRLNQLPETKACFARACKTQEAVEALKLFWHYTLQHHYWDEAIATLKTHLSLLSSPEAEKVGLKYYFIYALSRSSLTPGTLDSNRRKHLEEFIKERILPTPWTQYLFPLHVGIALEKIGSLVETLEFYENYINSSVQSLRTAARDRWLATKLRQANYSRASQQPAKVKRIEKEIQSRARQWEIPLDTLSLAPPNAPSQHPHFQNPPQASQQPNPQRAHQIRGLPEGTPRMTIGSQIVKFRLRHLIVKVMFATQQVLITDVLSAQRLRIDVQLQQVSWGTFTVESRGGNPLIFSDPQGGYRGVIEGDRDFPHLKLQVQGIEQAIAIEF
ncbi:MAG: hypothetical protein SW833_03105 [Cyanobacteriota bacterium]|nr:hypothetical protein [Cyanobacteriota bacterium]